MKKIIALVSGLALLSQAMPTMAAPPQPAKTKTFAQWCQQRNSVPAATKLTIDLLLQRTGTENCKIANAELTKLEDLSLGRTQIGDITKPISDLKPIASLTNLKNLFLENNKIVDLKPLIGLNKFSDLTPLAKFVDLVFLRLDRNQISDLKPLAGLKELSCLQLSNNKISDVKPLLSLTKLGYVTLNDNLAPDTKKIRLVPLSIGSSLMCNPRIFGD
jgi:internalin A